MFFNKTMAAPYGIRYLNGPDPGSVSLGSIAKEFETSVHQAIGLSRSGGLNGDTDWGSILGVVSAAVGTVAKVGQKIKARNTAKDDLNAMAGDNARDLIEAWEVLEQMKGAIKGKYTSNFPMSLAAEQTGKYTGRAQIECLAGGYKWVGWCETKWVKIGTFTAAKDRLRNAELRVEHQGYFANELESELNRVRKILEAEAAAAAATAKAAGTTTSTPSFPGIDTGFVTSGGGSWMLPAGILLAAGVVAKKKGWI